MDNGTTMAIALFDSDACSHEELDKRQQDTIKELEEHDALVLEYAAKRMILRGIDPYNILGSIPQKIIKNQELPEVLIPVS